MDILVAPCRRPLIRARPRPAREHASARGGAVATPGARVWPPSGPRRRHSIHGPLGHGSRRRETGVCGAGGAEPLVPLGHDVLKFLAAFVIITPVFKRINVSPILGFLLTGLLLRQADAIAGPDELSELAELGVLFLLFEMGLELSTDRLRALAKYAFGLGSAQVLLTTLAFVAFAVPFGASLGTLLLQRLSGADVKISSITSWDEAVVIAVALSLSSSAFVLQLLGERGQLASRSGSATLGILLLQDIVTVPFLVLLPLLEAPGAPRVTDLASPGLAAQFFPAVAQSAALIGGIALFGRLGLRRAFEVVAATGNGDAFVAASLLTVCGTSLATEAAGFGQTLGAFLAGILLAESSFRPQVEAEIKPFKGVLLGLFFLCTGAAVDVQTLAARFPTIALLTVGLISIKFTITSVVGRSFFGLTEAESIKVGLTLAQGGEFAFVLLALAQDLRVLPGDLNKLLICVVVMSMALTPFLADIGDYFEQREALADAAADSATLNYELMTGGADVSDGSDASPAAQALATRGALEPMQHPVVILAFNEASQVVATMLSSPLTGRPQPWLAFSLNPDAVRAANARSLPVIFGDGASPDVLHAAGVETPRAFVLTHRSHPQLMSALREIRVAFPAVPCFALCVDVRRAAEARALDACAIVTRASSGVALGDAVLRGLMDTAHVDLLYLERAMQLAVLDAVDDIARDTESTSRWGPRSNAGSFILDFRPMPNGSTGSDGRSSSQQIWSGSQWVAHLLESKVRGTSIGASEGDLAGGGAASSSSSSSSTPRRSGLAEFFSPVLPNPVARRVTDAKARVADSKARQAQDARSARQDADGTSGRGKAAERRSRGSRHARHAPPGARGGSDEASGSSFDQQLMPHLLSAGKAGRRAAPQEASDSASAAAVARSATSTAARHKPTAADSDAIMPGHASWAREGESEVTSAAAASRAVLPGASVDEARSNGGSGSRNGGEDEASEGARGAARAGADNGAQ